MSLLSVPVLQRHEMRFKITNASPIATRFKALVHHKDSVFDIQPASVELQPGQVVDMLAVALLDEVRGEERDEERG